MCLRPILRSGTGGDAGSISRPTRFVPDVEMITMHVQHCLFFDEPDECAFLEAAEPPKRQRKR